MQLQVRELSVDEYPLWDKLVTVSPQRSLFAQRWWMDIVTRGGVRLLGCFDVDRLLAGLPIWPCTTLGVKRLRQPPLTPYWGPLLQAFPGKYTTQLGTEMEVLRAFASALAAWRDIAMTFHPSLRNWLPFAWSGFTQTTRYTYRIENLDENIVTDNGLHRTLRNALNRADKHCLAHVEMVDPSIISDMSHESMARQELQSSAEIRAFWPELVRAAQERQCYYSSAAVDPEGNIHAAYALMWDERYAYHLYGGGPARYRESGGGTFALLNLLRQALTVAPSFDFEGSMVEPINRYFRQFGGELTPYLSVSRASSTRLNLARAAQGWLNARQRRRSAMSEPAEAAKPPVAA